MEADFMVQKEQSHNKLFKKMIIFKLLNNNPLQQLSSFYKGVVILFFMVACHDVSKDIPLNIKPKIVDIPNVWAIADSTFRHSEGHLLKNNFPFSGYQFSLFSKGDTAYIIPYFEGKEEGLVKTFYPHHQLESLRFYSFGKKEGEHRGYWENGQLKFVFHFQNDLHEGNAKEWAQSGQIYRDFNYKNGQEAGIQRIWYPDGTLAANYEAKNGRNYGLTGVKNCVSVGDSLNVH